MFCGKGRILAIARKHRSLSFDAGEGELSVAHDWLVLLSGKLLR